MASWAEPHATRWPLWLALVALHAALIPLLSPTPRLQPRESGLSIRWLQELSPAPRPAVPQPGPRLTPAPGTSTRAPFEPKVPAPAVMTSAAPVSKSVEATPPAPAASLPAQPLLINTEATRRAVRMMARDALLSERAQAATGLEPHEAQGVRLAREMREAGRGDCIKGEFAGGGMGLLSLPFFLIAEARGACAK